MQATGSSHDLALRKADFSTLCEALDYAAQGTTGVNFFSARGEIYASATYAELREEAIALARRLSGLGIAPGGRVALVAETSPQPHLNLGRLSFARGGKFDKQLLLDIFGTLKFC